MRVVLSLLMLFLTGCLSTARDENVQLERVERRYGTDAGKPTDFTTKTTERTTTQEKASSGVDTETLTALASAAANAATGNYQGALSAAVKSMAPAPQPQIDWAALGAAGVALLTTSGFGIQRHMSASRKERRIEALNEDRVNLAKQIPVP